MDNILTASLTDFESIEGYGSIMAQSIFEFFSLDSTRHMIEKYKELGLNMTEPDTQIDNRFEGMTFVLTGTLEGMSRNDASAIIESMGGKVSSSVSKKTTYVLAGEEAGSKLEKANALGVKVISKEDFLEMTK